MRPDVAPLGTLMFPHRLAGSALRLDADSYPQRLSRWILPFPVWTSVSRSCPVPVSSQGTTRMSRSLPGITAAVGPPL